jgi:uncharacterized protein YhdP
MLLVNGNADGPTSEFFKFIQASPVRRMIDGVTDPMAATGNGRLQLRLDLPLHDLPKSKVAGEYQFSGNTTTVDARLPPIEKASGRVGFTENSFHGARSARAAVRRSGRDRRRNESRRRDHRDRARRGDGRRDGRAVRPSVAREALGLSPYTANVSMKGGRTQISFETQLRGVTSDLPPPLAKSAAEQVPLRVDIFPIENRDRISVMVGKIATADFLRAKVGSEMQVQRTAVALSPVAGEAVRVPERPGTTVYGSLPALDLDRWIPLFASEGASRAPAAPGAGVRESRPASRRSRRPGQAPDERFAARRHRFDRVVGDPQRGGDGGRAELSLRRLGTAGRAALPLAHPGRFAGRESGEATKELPAIDLVAEKFTHRGKPVGRVEVARGTTARTGASTGWSSSTRRSRSPEPARGAPAARRAWRSSSSSNRATSASSSSASATRTACTAAARRSKGSLAWNGSPLALDYPSLSGELHADRREGRVPQITSGFGRVLSLLSLSFNDAAAKGLPFDAISSSFQVSKGVMSHQGPEDQGVGRGNQHERRDQSRQGNAEPACQGGAEHAPRGDCARDDGEPGGRHRRRDRAGHPQGAGRPDPCVRVHGQRDAGASRTCEALGATPREASGAP